MGHHLVMSSEYVYDGRNYQLLCSPKRIELRRIADGNNSLETKRN
jgi:hypothetical protein